RQACLTYFWFVYAGNGGAPRGWSRAPRCCWTFSLALACGRRRWCQPRFAGRRMIAWRTGRVKIGHQLRRKLGSNLLPRVLHFILRVQQLAHADPDQQRVGGSPGTRLVTQDRKLDGKVLLVLLEIGVDALGVGLKESAIARGKLLHHPLRHGTQPHQPLLLVIVDPGLARAHGRRGTRYRLRRPTG